METNNLKLMPMTEENVFIEEVTCLQIKSVHYLYVTNKIKTKEDEKVKLIQPY